LASVVIAVLAYEETDLGGTADLVMEDHWDHCDGMRSMAGQQPIRGDP
jgi:hypothetical protein